MLANVTIDAKNTEVVYKGCKDGYLFALNASNGSMNPVPQAWVDRLGRSFNSQSTEPD